MEASAQITTRIQGAFDGVVSQVIVLMTGLLHILEKPEQEFAPATGITHTEPGITKVANLTE